MGYYITTTDVDFFIPTENLDEAYKALCELNNHNELKNGGRHPCEKKDGPHDGVWFSWMDWNYPETCANTAEILESLGFECNEDDEGLSIWGYDSKAGNEDIFIEALAPYVRPGSYIEWRGESGEMWREEFDEGVMTRKEGQIVWV